ncbi:hypothetical protein FGG08_002992 [Glutinoglossum americanum]|uniref:Glycosyltransferase family 28 N-terminal domain-containing protein n=1 Tax=Glutinoglossum americanum TaxID=1670608 RepID=A0A9P8IAN8_9PEZI|nr:hypothetical protein FGG08_002992 [Glutinoglossum americanum]
MASPSPPPPGTAKDPPLVATATTNSSKSHSSTGRPLSVAEGEAPGGSGAAGVGNTRDTKKARNGNDEVSEREGLVDEVPPPTYGQSYKEVEIEQDGLNTMARIADDGRVNINIDQRGRRLSNLLGSALRSQLDLQLGPEQPPGLPPGYLPPWVAGEAGQPPPPSLNIVIQVIGSRGDVQPFVSLGQTLKRAYGHRVRLATHSTFQQFVEENGLEFFNIGGDPAELMAFMVKNPGLMPGFETLRSGDIGKRRKGMYEMFKGCWRSCFEAGDGLGVEHGDGYVEDYASSDSGSSIGGNPATKPFVADAIIANPPSFAHVHCAEKMGIPLHLMFTMPWSPTQAFPHPLANIQSSNAEANLTNFISYALVEMMTWQGLGDVINRFREKSLGLEPVSVMWAPGMPAPDLAAFLSAGPPPVYIGFGSIVVDDPGAMTALVFEAVKKAGVRALVSKGWGGLGDGGLDVPPQVFMLGNVPHDWLFRHVSCVVHHGGAGTTAAGISMGKPTVVVPFFGDQPFWGAMVAKAGAGPTPTPYKSLTADRLASSILEALKPAVLERASELGSKIAQEQGSEAGARNFHDMLNPDNLRCNLAPSRTAVWRVKRTDIRLSALAATVLFNEGLLDLQHLKLYRPREYETEDGPWDPITGGASALLGTIGSLMMGVADFPVEIIKALKPKAGDASNTDTGLTHSPASRSSISLRSGADTADGGNTPDGDSNVTIKAGEQRTSSLASELSNPLPEEMSPISPSSSGNTRSSMALAMSGRLSRSNSGSRLSSSFHRVGSDCAPQAAQVTLDAAIGATKSVSRIVSASLKSPMDFTLSLARGFHNAPKLYGDTVRPSDKVTGIQSGLKAAGKEFGYGLYDGISGLITQPLKGAKDEGATGLVKGIGKGIGGLVLKPSAAFWGLPGYTFQGIAKEIQKHLGSSVQSYIIAARTAQGYEDWNSSGEEERLDIINRWHHTQAGLKNSKRKFTMFDDHMKKAEGKFGERKKSGKESGDETFTDRKKPAEQKHKGAFKRDLRSFFDRDPPDIHSQNPPTLNRESQDAQFEQAINASVTATSRGDPEEDMLIERAIRASVAELQSAREAQLSEQEAIERAIRASVLEASRDPERKDPPKYHDSTKGRVVNKKALEESLQRSLQEYSFAPEHVATPRGSSGLVDGEGHETPKGVIEESKRQDTAESRESQGRSISQEEEENLRKAIEESEKAYKQQEGDRDRVLIEEQILLQYVEQQSLKEE